MDVSADWSGRNVEDYLVKLREGQATLVRATREFLKKNQRKGAADGREERQESDQVRGGTIYPSQVLSPNKPPDKLSYRPSIVAQWRLLR